MCRPQMHQQSKQRECPTEYAEHTEHSGRESLPQIDTDAHRLGGYGIPAIPTPPITQPNHLWKSVKSVGEYYHAGAAASAAPTKQTERVSHRTRRTHRTFWQRKPPTDRHRLGGYGIPAIPTPPITQPNILWIPWENTTTLITKQTGRECSTEYAEHTENSGREVPPTDRHRCAQIKSN